MKRQTQMQTHHFGAQIGKAAMALVGALYISGAAMGADAIGDMPLMASPADLKWTALPERPGMQFTVLSGDPKSGPYTQLRTVPAGTDNPPHAHSSHLTNVIISGSWYTGVDLQSARDFGPGSIVVMPGGWQHVSGCRPGASCMFYQTGRGRFDFVPVAADQAAKAK